MRTAILKAANRIERHPDEFDFMSIDVPEPGACGTPGCALGWIGFYAKLKPHVSEGFVSVVANKMGLEGAAAFYGRMSSLNRRSDTHWTDTAKQCAKVLRKYADKYFPARDSR